MWQLKDEPKVEYTEYTYAQGLDLVLRTLALISHLNMEAKTLASFMSPEQIDNALDLCHKLIDTVPCDGRHSMLEIALAEVMALKTLLEMLMDRSRQ